MLKSLRHATIAVALLFVPAAPATTADQTPPASPPAAVHQPARLLEDFTLLRTALEEAHSGLYRYASREAMTGLFDAAAARLTTPMDEFAFFRIVAPVIAGLKDGHTALNPSDAGRAATAAGGLLPLRVRVLDGRLFVFRDLSADGGPLAGREITAINGRQVPAILRAMEGTLPGDGSIPTSRAHALSNGFRFNLLHAVLFGPADAYRVTVAGGGGTAPATLQGTPLAKLNETLAARHPQDNAPPAPAELAFLDNGAIAYLRITTFAGSADRERTRPLGAFLTDAFTQMAANKTRALVIDVRNNGGGQDALGKQLLAHLMDRPFQYYDGLFVNTRELSFAKHTDAPGPMPESMVTRGADGRLRMTRHPNLGEQQPAAPGFGGKVYILMNGGSFSTTAEFLSLAHHHRRAVFIGEESGGGYEGNTSGPTVTVTLPNTGMRLRVPLLRYELAVKRPGAVDRGVMPDHRVPVTIADLIAGGDKEKEFALTLARKELPPESRN